MVGVCAGFQVPQHVQFLGGRCWRGFQLLGEANLPAGSLDHIFPGYVRVQGSDHQLLGLRVRLEDTQVGDHHGGPRPMFGTLSRALPSRPKPTVVTKSTSFTNVRLECFTVMNTSLALVAISGAPPPPGRRTFGSR